MAATLAVAALVLSAASAAISAKQRSDNLRFSAKVAAQQAARARQIGVVKARQFADQQKRARSRQRAQFAARGVVPSVGSPLLVQEENAAEDKFQELLIRDGAEARAVGLDTRAKQNRAQAGQALLAGGLQVGSSLLSAGSKI